MDQCGASAGCLIHTPLDDGKSHDRGRPHRPCAPKTRLATEGTRKSRRPKSDPKARIAKPPVSPKTAAMKLMHGHHRWPDCMQRSRFSLLSRATASLIVTPGLLVLFPALNLRPLVALARQWSGTVHVLGFDERLLLAVTAMPDYAARTW